MYTYPLAASQSFNQQRFITLFEQSFAIVSLLYCSNGLFTVLGEDSTAIKLIRYSLLLVGGVLCLMRWQGTLRTLKKGLLLWPLIGLVLISFLWSDHPSLAIESIRAEVLPSTVFAIYFSSRFHPRQQLRLLAIALGIAALLSLFYVFAIPSVGRHLNDAFNGAWKGIFVQKNKFAAYMTMTLLCYFVLGSNNKHRQERLMARCGLVFSTGMIILSTSKTGLVVFIVLLAALSFYKAFRWRGTQTVFFADVLILISVVGFTYVFSNWALLLSGLGRDPTLTGRTFIWAGALAKLKERFWFGYGRSSFWMPENITSEFHAVGLPIEFIPPHAHNGYVDLLIELGAVGLILFLIGYLVTFYLSIKRAYCAKTPEDFWPLAIMLLILIYNITESMLMRSVNLFWVMYLINFLTIRLWSNVKSDSS